MMNRLKVALDADDILFMCNQHAVDTLNKEKGYNFTLRDITSWGILGNPIDERLEYFEKPDFFKSMPVYDGAKEFVHVLSKKAEIFIITSVHYKCVGVRVEQILENFPEIPVENIFLGSRKSLVDVDILFDDGIHNIMEANASYPVLRRQPWNESASGIVSVNNYNEFLAFVDTVLQARNTPSLEPEILCMVGPSGAGKTTVIETLLQNQLFTRVKTWTTRKPRSDDRPDAYHYATKNAFLSEEFFESTVYGGNFYGTKIHDVEAAMKKGIVLMALDICGCMAMKHHFKAKCALVYVDRNKEHRLDSVLTRNISLDEIKKRIISMDIEEKNSELCDFIVNNDGNIDATVDQIMNILK